MLSIALLAGGCEPAAPRAQVLSERLQIERRALAAELEHLEDRMVADAGRVRFWQEMRQRHEGVSAVACNGLERHAEGMALVAKRQAKVKRVVRAKRSRVATRWPAAP